MTKPASDSLFGSLLAVGALLAGCMGSGDTSAGRVYSEIEARADEHHAAAASAKDVQGLLTETRDYAEDIGNLTGDLTAAYSGGTVCWCCTGRDTVRLDDLTSRTKEAVNAHRTRMAGLVDLAAMRSECNDQHTEMAALLSEMHEMLVDDGMM